MNYDFFRKWSPEMAYYLGYIWADGSVTKNYLALGCVEEDQELILNFIKLIGSHHKIIRRPGCWDEKDGKKFFRKPRTQISIAGQQFVEPLINEHGILPRKTYLDLPFPNVEMKYLPHFIRGYFDGDGSIYKTGDIIKVSMVGSHKFVSGIQKSITKATGIPAHQKCKNSKSFIYNIEWGKKAEVLAFLNFMYSEDGPALARKKNLASKYSDELAQYCQRCGITHDKGRIRVRLLGKLLGEYRTTEDAQFARNYAHLQHNGYPYPVPAPDIISSRQQEIMSLIDRRLAGDKSHQRKIL